MNIKTVIWKICSPHQQHAQNNQPQSLEQLLQLLLPLAIGRAASADISMAPAIADQCTATAAAAVRPAAHAVSTSTNAAELE